MVSPEKPDPTAVFVPDNKDFLPNLEKLDHLDHKLWVEYFGKLKKQLPTWLAKIVNILIVLGALLSILACPIWVHSHWKFRPYEA